MAKHLICNSWHNFKEHEMICLLHEGQSGEIFSYWKMNKSEVFKEEKRGIV